MDALNSGQPQVASITWWLDTSALPNRYWARLRTYEDGSAEVFVLIDPSHPERRRFANEAEARNWLLEDEFESLAGLIEDGEIPAGTSHPMASSDEELVSRMFERIQSEDGGR